MTNFDKAGFIEYINRNFSYNGATKRIISNLVDYGMNYAADNGELRDMIAYVTEELSYEEIEQFCHEEA